MCASDGNQGDIKIDSTNAQSEEAPVSSPTSPAEGERRSPEIPESPIMDSNIASPPMDSDIEDPSPSMRHEAEEDSTSRPGPEQPEQDNALDAPNGLEPGYGAAAAESSNAAGPTAEPTVAMS